jgi:hypothetical protein
MREPCFTDSDEFRFEPDGPEDTDPRTDAEKRIEWICNEWKYALDDDNYESWHDVRMMCYGAIQALNQCSGSKTAMDDYRMFSTLGDIAFNNGSDCIQDGKYEGAK